MYSFKANIPVNEFTSFVEKASYAPIQQTAGWTKLKNNWESSFCGIYKDDEMIGAALILMRKLIPGFTFAYCPRGPIMDLCNKEALEAFVDGAKKFCKQKGVYLLKVDPAVVAGKTLPEIPTEKFLDPFDLERGKAEFESLVSCGFKHQGYGLEMDSATQPRFHALIPLKDAAGNPLTEAQLKKNYRATIRKKMGGFQTSRGLYYEGAEHTPENIALFKKILGDTEKRQNISLRNEEYFSLLAEGFGDNAFFAFERCHPQTYIDYLEKRLENEPQNTDKINELLENAKKIYEEKGDAIPLAALLTIYPHNTEGIKVAEYLYAGADLTVFSSFSATLCGLFAQCSLCVEKGCDFLNLGGLSGHFDDGLYEFKSAFNPIIVEYAGDFDLPISEAKYAIMEKGLPILKRAYKKVLKIFKK